MIKIINFLYQTKLSSLLFSDMQSATSFILILMTFLKEIKQFFALRNLKSLSEAIKSKYQFLHTSLFLHNKNHVFNAHALSQSPLKHNHNIDSYSCIPVSNNYCLIAQTMQPPPPSPHQSSIQLNLLILNQFSDHGLSISLTLCVCVCVCVCVCDSVCLCVFVLRVFLRVFVGLISSVTATI